MPKIKTHKPTSKRYRISQGGKGKLMRTRYGKQGSRRNKSVRVRAEFDQMHVVEPAGLKRRIRRLAPYLRLISK